MLRTRDEAFATVPDFPYRLRCFGLEGQGGEEGGRGRRPSERAVVLIHPEPTSSSQSAHAYAAHIEWVHSALFDHLDPQGITRFCRRTSVQWLGR